MLPRLSDRVGGAGGAGHREPMGCHSPWGTLASPAVGKGEGLILGAGRVGLSHCPVQAFGCPGWRLSLRPLSSLSTVARAPLFFPADRTVTTTSEPPAWPTQ